VGDARQAADNMTAMPAALKLFIPPHLVAALIPLEGWLGTLRLSKSAEC
jgi:hypothetical protein